MSHRTAPILAALALALGPFVSGAEASVGESSGGALSSLGRQTLVQNAQADAGCWYDNGWSGPGYYPCGDEWNSRPGSVGALGPIMTPLKRGHHRHGVGVAPVPNTAYRGVQPPLGAGVGAAQPPADMHGRFRPVPALRGGAPALHTFGAPAGAFRPGAIGAAPRIGAPALPGVGIQHYGAGIGSFHPGAIGAPHIGASTAAGAPGSFHGVRGIGVPSGVGTFSPSGVGHR